MEINIQAAAAEEEGRGRPVFGRRCLEGADSKVTLLSQLTCEDSGPTCLTSTRSLILPVREGILSDIVSFKSIERSISRLSHMMFLSWTFFYHSIT